MASNRVWMDSSGEPVAPPPSPSQPLALTPEQRGALVRLFYRTPHEWRQARNRAVALLVLLERLRPAEVAALTIEEATALHDDLRDRTEPVRRSQLTREALADWLRRRAAERMPGEWAFPVGTHGAPCAPRDVYRLLRRVLRAAGVDPGQVGRLNIKSCVRRTSAERIRARMRARALAGAAPQR